MNAEEESCDCKEGYSKEQKVLFTGITVLAGDTIFKISSNPFKSAIISMAAACLYFVYVDPMKKSNLLDEPNSNTSTSVSHNVAHTSFRINGPPRSGDFFSGIPSNNSINPFYIN